MAFSLFARSAEKNAAIVAALDQLKTSLETAEHSIIAYANNTKTGMKLSDRAVKDLEKLKKDEVTTSVSFKKAIERARINKDAPAEQIIQEWHKWVSIERKLESEWNLWMDMHKKIFKVENYETEMAAILHRLAVALKGIRDWTITLHNVTKADLAVNRSLETFLKTLIAEANTFFQDYSKVRSEIVTQSDIAEFDKATQAVLTNLSSLDKDYKYVNESVHMDTKFFKSAALSLKKLLALAHDKSAFAPNLKPVDEQFSAVHAALRNLIQASQKSYGVKIDVMLHDFTT